MRRLTLMLFIAAMTGCMADEDPVPGSGPATADIPAAVTPVTGSSVTVTPVADTPQTGAPKTEAACREAGGRWAAGGMRHRHLCFLPTPDAGKSCTAAGDCTGVCLAETGTCSAETPRFGCFAIFASDGARRTICVD